MISQSQIFARINQADGMVSFLEDPEEVRLHMHISFAELDLFSTTQMQ